jgi:hypothetical protein
MGLAVPATPVELVIRLIARILATKRRTTMANQWKIESIPDLRKLVAKVIATRTGFFQLLCAGAVGLFLFVGTAHAQCPTTSPCILVSNYGTGQVEVYSDDGKTVETSALLSGCPSPYCLSGAAGGGEGIACLSGKSNVMYIANNGAYINAFDLATGIWKGGLHVGGQVAGMVANAAGTMIYAGQDSSGNILSLAPLGAAPYLKLTATTPPHLLDDSHDIAIGTYPPSLAGDVFTSYFPHTNSGVNQFLVVAT